MANPTDDVETARAVISAVYSSVASRASKKQAAMQRLLSFRDALQSMRVLQPMLRAKSLKERALRRAL